ncbi:MAG: DUF3592 domain-containing protein [Ruminococcus sp.]|nr:DUF3592 domain-containing protein [Ruminococcus sp.]
MDIAERPNLNEAPESAKRTVLILLIITALLAAIGVVHRLMTRNKITSCSAVTKGTVTGITHVLKLKGSSPKYRRKIAYTAKDGTEYTLKSQKTLRKADEGDTVTVYYDPHKPKRAVIEELPPDGGVTEFIFAGITLLTAVICLAYKPKQQPAARG